jgi:hypothetical protein
MEMTIAEFYQSINQSALALDGSSPAKLARKRIGKHHSKDEAADRQHCHQIGKYQHPTDT